MTPNEYQKLAERTECDQSLAAERMTEKGGIDRVRLTHAVTGLCGEVGELASLLQKLVYYGTISEAEFRAKAWYELGDVLWYVAQMCNTLEADMLHIMAKNIDKLRHRYPHKFDADRCANRDTAAEEGRVGCEADGEPD